MKLFSLISIWTVSLSLLLLSFNFRIPDVEKIDRAEAATTTNQDTVQHGELPRQRGYITAYTSRKEETDDTPCISASGIDICWYKETIGEVCASNDYPFGTKLLVDSLGECTVLDRMASRYTNKGRVDWYFGQDLPAAQTFGIQSKMVLRLD